MIGSTMILAGLSSVVYVSPTAGPDGTGSLASPVRLERAIQESRPGVVIQLAAGRYPLAAPLRFPASGAPGQWIEVAGPVEGEAVLDGSGWRPASAGEAHSTGLVDIKGQSWLRLKRLTVVESFGFGIHVHSGSSFIDLQDLRVDHTFAPGIGLWNSQDIRVVGCEITRANTQTKRIYGSRAGECPHEALSIAGINRFEAAWNRVHHCQKEGIDVKEVSQNGVVHHNYVYNLDRQGLYVDAWFGTLQNVKFLSNVVHDCEWGMVASAEGKDSELIGVDIINNVFYRNRASGFYFGTWGGNGPRSRILLASNTFWRNGSRSHWAGPTGSIDLRATNAKDVLVNRNLLLEGGAYEIAAGQGEADLAARNIVIEDNFLGSLALPSLEGLEMGPYGSPQPMTGKDPKTGEVKLEGPKFGVFLFAPESAAKPVGYGALAPEALAAAQFQPPLQGFEPYHPMAKGLPPILLEARERLGKAAGQS